MLVYFVKCHSLIIKDPVALSQQIIEANPDRIICWCAEEFAYYEIFNPLFDLLEEWAISNNKTADLITTNKSGYIRSWVTAESTHGLVYGFMFAHKISYSDLSKEKNFISINNEHPPQKINPNKLFTCYNHHYQPERGLLVDLLARDKLIDSNIVTFHYPKNYNWMYHDGSRLVDEEDFELNKLNTLFLPNIIPKNQVSTFMDIVPESRYDQGEFFVTEKTLKSVMLFRPFLTLSCQGFHRYLVDKFGFKLYDEIFDYKFDTNKFVEDRIEGIIDNIKQITQKFSNPNQLYDAIRPKLLHNKNQIEEIFSNKDLIVPQSLRFLMEEEVTIVGNTYGDLPTYMRIMGWMKE
jgi:hypothetical protein